MRLRTRLGCRGFRLNRRSHRHHSASGPHDAARDPPWVRWNAGRRYLRALRLAREIERLRFGRPARCAVVMSGSAAGRRRCPTSRASSVRVCSGVMSELSRRAEPGCGLRASNSTFGGEPGRVEAGRGGAAGEHGGQGGGQRGVVDLRDRAQAGEDRCRVGGVEQAVPADDDGLPAVLEQRDGQLGGLGEHHRVAGRRRRAAPSGRPR